MKYVKPFIFWLLIVLGFVLRIISLFHNGMFDVATYHEWGLNTLNNGLSQSYQGIYFPLQYQIFELCSWIATEANIEYFIVFKSANLIFDTGNLFLLYLIFKRMNIHAGYLLLYWVHPWFLNVFSLGYCDFQFTFFILGALLFSLRSAPSDYLKAGIFLGLAFLMKPQTEIIVLSLFIYGALFLLKKRDMKILNIFIFPVILFLNYLLYFIIAGGGPFLLPHTYINAADASVVCLNANFLNIWFPVAYFMKESAEPIYSVSDLTTVAGIPLRLIAMTGVLTLIFLVTRRLIRKSSERKIDTDVFLLTCFSVLTMPFIMTSAHENHLFAGSVLIIPLLALFRSVIFRSAVHIILILQAINIYGYYGIGEFPGIHLPDIGYSYEKALILSFIAAAAFLVILYYFFTLRSFDHTLNKQNIEKK